MPSDSIKNDKNNNKNLPQDFFEGIKTYEEDFRLERILPAF